VARYLVYYHPGDPVPDRMKYVDDATGAPDANDDAATLGVTVGSLWVDTTAPAVYACADAATGAAVWVELSGGGSIDWGEDADITTLDYDDVADAGVLDEAARADHVHGMPAEGAGGGGHYELLMTGASPPEPLEDGTGADWLYVFVSD
jgi:hypothetical protein